MHLTLALWAALAALAALAGVLGLRAALPPTARLAFALPAADVPEGSPRLYMAGAGQQLFMVHLSGDRWLALAPYPSVTPGLPGEKDSLRPGATTACAVRWEPAWSAFVEPCQGSVFSLTGVHVGGPAPHSLWAYRVCQRRGPVGAELVVQVDSYAAHPAGRVGPVPACS